MDEVDMVNVLLYEMALILANDKQSPEERKAECFEKLAKWNRDYDERNPPKCTSS